MFDTPILFLIFNRPDTTKMVFEQIAKVKPSKLYVAADGPRFDKPDEAILCAEARKVVADRLDWDCEVKYLYREDNLGCKLAVSGAINWFFKQEEAGIILEDDCLPDNSFFYFCQEMLILYKDDESIMSINGCNFGYNYDKASYFYSRMMNVWGWGTWRRVAEKIEYNITRQEEKEGFSFIRSRLRSSFFDYDIKWFKYWEEVFKSLAADELNTWDYQWVYFQLLWKKKSIVASKNLIENIGIRDDATHTTSLDHFAVNLKKNVLSFPLTHNRFRHFDLGYENKTLKLMYLEGALPNSFYIKKWLRKNIFKIVIQFKDTSINSF